MNMKTNDRTSNMTKEPSYREDEHTAIALIRQDVKYIKNAIDKLPETYVSKSEYKPVEKLVYGIATAFGLGVVASILRVILK